MYDLDKGGHIRTVHTSIHLHHGCLGKHIIYFIRTGIRQALLDAWLRVIV